jgi:hypothetical protein
MKIVEVREIFAYVRAFFDASEKVAPYQFMNSLPRLESVRLRPVESSQTRVRLCFALSI